MENNRTLIDLGNEDERGIILPVLKEGFSGQNPIVMEKDVPVYDYFDIDYLSTPELIGEFAKLLSEKILALYENTSQGFDTIAFIRNANGPQGMLARHDLLIAQLGIFQPIFVDIKTMTRRNYIKGSFNEDSRVLILSDVSESGLTIAMAANRIWDWGAKVPYALVVVNKSQGATMNIGVKDIKLFSLVSFEQLDGYGDTIANKYDFAVNYSGKKQYIMFGAV